MRRKEGERQREGEGERERGRAGERERRRREKREILLTVFALTFAFAPISRRTHSQRP